MSDPDRGLAFQRPEQEERKRTKDTKGVPEAFRHPHAGPPRLEYRIERIKWTGGIFPITNQISRLRLKALLDLDFATGNPF
jgi:hypothetical protein